jgi:hypothetical protein
MEESRRRGRQVLLIIAAMFLCAGDRGVRAVLRKVVAAGGLGQQGPAHPAGAACRGSGLKHRTAAPRRGRFTGQMDSYYMAMAPATPTAARRWCSGARRAWR